MSPALRGGLAYNASLLCYGGRTEFIEATCAVAQQLWAG